MRAGYASFWLVVLLAIVAVVGAGLTGHRQPPVAPATIAGALGLDETDAVELDRERATVVNAMTARCMAARGLPYPATVEPPPVIPDASLDPVAWADRWGFGVTTSVGTTGASTVVVDPVEDLVASWPANEKERYRAALRGNDEVPGCLPRATDAVYGARDRLLAPLEPAFRSLEASVEGDQRMTPIRDAWTVCARSVALPLHIAEAEVARDRLPSRLIDWFVAALTQPGGGAGQRLLAIRERTVAGAIARCDMAFSKARTVVAAPYEAEFVARHRTELQAIGVAIREAESERRLDGP